MQKNSEKMNDFSLQQAMRMAQSDAGKQLFSLLQSTQADTLQTAMEQAKSGNYAEVKKTLEKLMQSKQAKELMEKMQGDNNG